MKITHLFYLVLITVFITNCSSDPKWETALLDGKITVADSVDNSGDYSGIEVIITYQESIDSEIDTLFNKKTNKSGVVQGKVKFPEKAVYPVFLKRNGAQLAATQFILADKDTISFTGELPDLNQNFKVDSREHRAMNTFNRIDRGFKRVSAFIEAGAVADSLIYDEVYKWSEIFWEVAQKNENTIASDLAASESVRLLNIIDKDLMIKRIDEALNQEGRIFIAANYGFPQVSKVKGIEKGVEYLDSLIALTDNDDVILTLKQQKIEAYFDSSKVEEAKSSLEIFEKEYKTETSAMEWAKIIGYDLAYLAPGYRVPNFSFNTQEGDSVNAASLIGKPYILEITPVASRLYQDQYDRTVVIYQIYQNYGLEIYTIPLDRSEVTVKAFFEDRVKHWSVASFDTFDIQKLIETFNVTDVPTRILVDKKGNIVRKYVTTEFTDVIQGMNNIINQTKRDS
jgi:glutathione peroxidase-family protein